MFYLLFYSILISFQIYTFYAFRYFIETSKVWKKPKYNSLRSKFAVFDSEVKGRGGWGGCDIFITCKEVSQCKTCKSNFLAYCQLWCYGNSHYLNFLFKFPGLPLIGGENFCFTSGKFLVIQNYLYSIKTVCSLW